MRKSLPSSLDTRSFALVLLLLAGCGGGSPTPVQSTPSPNPSNTAPGNGGTVTSPVQALRVVNVSSGQTASSIDINVASPGTSAGANAELLGTSDLNSGTTATNSGGVIHRGSTMKVVLFGRALSGSLRITVGGPQDITISNIRSVTATDGTAGVAFDAAVSGSAALGARTVYLRSANDDITAFTGGLEVIP